MQEVPEIETLDEVTETPPEEPAEQPTPEPAEVAEPAEAEAAPESSEPPEPTEPELPAERESLEGRLAREFLELQAACPEVDGVDALPDAVLRDAVETGRHLFDSLLRYRYAQSRRVEEARAARHRAAENALGSLRAAPEAPAAAENEAMLRGVWN